METQFDLILSDIVSLNRDGHKQAFVNLSALDGLFNLLKKKKKNCMEFA